MNDHGVTKTAGYYYENYGGDCTYCILPKEVMELDCLIPLREILSLKHRWQNLLPALRRDMKECIIHPKQIIAIRWE